MPKFLLTDTFVQFFPHVRPLSSSILELAFITGPCRFWSARLWHLVIGETAWLATLSHEVLYALT